MSSKFISDFSYEFVDGICAVKAEIESVYFYISYLMISGLSKKAGSGPS
jgi:hypothetical protein